MAKKNQNNQQNQAKNKFLARMQNNFLMVKDKKIKIVEKKMNNNLPSKRQQQNTTIVIA